MRGFDWVVASARITPKPVPCFRCRSRMITSMASRFTAASAAASVSAVPISSTSGNLPDRLRQALGQHLGVFHEQDPQGLSHRHTFHGGSTPRTSPCWLPALYSLRAVRALYAARHVCRTILTSGYWIRPLRSAYEVMSALALKLIFSRMRLR